MKKRLRYKEYLNQSEKFWLEATKFISEKEYAQASEKAWGSVALLVKSYAELNGFSHDGHAKLFQVIEELTRKLNDNEIRRLFLVANSLHINFYENWLTPRIVEDSITDIKLLREKIKNEILMQNEK